MQYRAGGNKTTCTRPGRGYTNLHLQTTPQLHTKVHVPSASGCQFIVMTGTLIEEHPTEVTLTTLFNLVMYT